MTDNSITKTCTKCGLNLPASEFSKDKSKRDGLASRCIGCAKVYYEANREKILEQSKTYRKANREKIAVKDKTYYEANREKILEQSKAYYEANREKAIEYGMSRYRANREKIAESRKTYYEDNREKFAEQSKTWRKANREEIAAQKKAYREANREKLAAQKKAYYEANREKIAAQRKTYYKANPDIYRANRQNRRARKRNAEGAHTSEQVQARFEVHGNTCIYCGSPDDLHVDHIKPLARSGSNWASNLAPACAKCNLSKNDKWGKALLRWLKQNCTVARTSRILTAILT